MWVGKNNLDLFSGFFDILGREITEIDIGFQGSIKWNGNFAFADR